MKKATIIKMVLGAALGLAPLLGNEADAHVSGGNYTNSCSPHGAVASKGGSVFFNCSHVYNSANYPRDVACPLGSGCYTNGYYPNVGTCSGDKFVQGASVQTSSHALAPAWEAWTCSDKLHKGSACGDGTSSFNFMCVSDSCSGGACVGTVAYDGSCSNDDQCAGTNVCDGTYGKCWIAVDHTCHEAFGTYYTCANGEPCTGYGRSSGVCKSGDNCVCNASGEA